MEQNLPTVKVIWDPESQSVTFAFEPQEFKNWEQVAMVLGMAHLKAEFELKRRLGAAFQQQAVQAQQDHLLRQKILRGN